MKKIKRRANAALLLAALILAGLALYVFRFAKDGGDWVMFPANQHLYHEGVLNAGTLTDRNGVLLASAGDGIYRYAEDAATRMACLHTVGDYARSIGTGAIAAFSDRMAGYDPINGTYSRGDDPLALTIDAELCKTAYEALSGRNGAVLLSDYTNGEILCMTSAVSFDPMNIPDLSQSQYAGAYLNRCISSTFTPGSVYKLMTLAAAIESIDDLYDRSFLCTGSVEVGGNTVTCSGWHGEQTIEQALANSCNCAFAELSLELGGDTLAEYAEKLGLTTAHDLNGIPTAAGSFEAAAEGTSDLAWSGIGQYTDLVSPYAMLRLVSAIANGGALTEPTLLPEGNGESRLLDRSTADALAEMMDYTVTYAYGDWLFPGLSVCAKTGTAELGDGTSHAWFVGFLDDPDHPYAFVVMIEQGGGGLSQAGTLANTLLQKAVALTD